ncbi:MAG: heme-copper oxidase subunit III [Blastocatellia bacterium]
MPTTFTTPKTNEPAIGGGTNLPPIDIDEWGGGGGGGNDSLPERMPPPEGYRIALWLTLVSVTMLFLSLASAYIFLRADTQPIVAPRAFWVSTASILCSSVTMEFARRALRRRNEENRFTRWGIATFLLSGIFLLSQLAAWRQLVAEGFYVNRNLRAGLAYIFTGLHAVHVLGGIAALAYVMLKPKHRWTSIRRRVSFDAVALYWHFIGGIWVMLLALVFLWK